MTEKFVGKFQMSEEKSLPGRMYPQNTWEKRIKELEEKQKEEWNSGLIPVRKFNWKKKTNHDKLSNAVESVVKNIIK